MSYKCNCCENDSRKILFKNYKYNIVKCNNCKLVAIENPISPSNAKDHYNMGYYSGPDGLTDSSCYALSKEIWITEAESRLNKIGKVSSLLDVGCGLGHFLMMASKRGIKAVGVDISENAARYAISHGLDVRAGDLLYLEDFKKESFDVVTFWSSIEHLYDPKATLQKVNTLLKPGGLVVIETADVDSCIARLFEKNWRMIKTDHNFHFSSKTLENMLERTNFKPVKTEHEGFVEAIITQMGLRKAILESYSQDDPISKRRKSSLKEEINRIVGRLKFGDVIVKYARKT